MIPQEAIEAAADAMQQYALTDDRDGQHPWTVYAQAALEAAAPFLRAQALEELTANSPRLPNDVREVVFESLGYFFEKFDLVSRQQGPSRHQDAPGYEWGDMCGDVERRIVAIVRARAATERGQG